jgi:SAM-dependent methyltransferase
MRRRIELGARCAGLHAATVSMNDATVEALAAINRAFYRDRAAEFSATRGAPWLGWQRVVPLLRGAAPGRALRVLDVGCGNGRFVRYLAQALAPGSIEAVGVDASEPLLEAARRAGPAGAHWQACDVVAAPEALPAGPFDLIALIALLHGIPGSTRRRALLDACARRLAPDGWLVFTTWRADLARERRLDWKSYSSRAAMPIDCSQLEPGDQLIPWGPGSDAVRYFHSFDEAELERLVSGLPLVADRRYRADGRTGEENEYLVYRAA